MCCLVLSFYTSHGYFIPLLLLSSLVSRRQQWKKAEEERLASRPDPSIPPGHCLMSQQERRHTLDVLTQRELYTYILLCLRYAHKCIPCAHTMSCMPRDSSFPFHHPPYFLCLWTILPFFLLSLSPSPPLSSPPLLSPLTQIKPV